MNLRTRSRFLALLMGAGFLGVSTENREIEASVNQEEQDSQVHSSDPDRALTSFEQSRLRLMNSALDRELQGIARLDPDGAEPVDAEQSHQHLQPCLRSAAIRIAGDRSGPVTGIEMVPEDVAYELSQWLGAEYGDGLAAQYLEDFTQRNELRWKINGELFASFLDEYCILSAEQFQAVSQAWRIQVPGDLSDLAMFYFTQPSLTVVACSMRLEQFDLQHLLKPQQVESLGQSEDSWKMGFHKLMEGELDDSTFEAWKEWVRSEFQRVTMMLTESILGRASLSDEQQRTLKTLMRGTQDDRVQNCFDDFLEAKERPDDGRDFDINLLRVRVGSLELYDPKIAKWLRREIGPKADDVDRFINDRRASRHRTACFAAAWLLGHFGGLGAKDIERLGQEFEARVDKKISIGCHTLHVVSRFPSSVYVEFFGDHGLASIERLLTSFAQVHTHGPGD